MIQNLLIGALGSLIASGLFLLLMYRLRPKLDLSPKIARTTYDGETVYALKVVNSGRRDAIEIQGELLMIEPQVVGGGVGRNILQVPLVRERWFQLNPAAEVGEKFGASFEFVVTTNLEEEWMKHKNSYLLFRVHARDAMSGFSRVFSTAYYSQSDIIAGRFGAGATMAVSA